MCRILLRFLVLVSSAAIVSVCVVLYFVLTWDSGVVCGKKSSGKELGPPNFFSASNRLRRGCAALHYKQLPT
jgi:hypothetical protein